MLSRSFCRKNTHAVSLLHRSGRSKKEAKANCFFSDTITTACDMKIPIPPKTQREICHATSLKRKTLVSLGQRTQPATEIRNKIASSFSSATDNFSSSVNCCPTIQKHRDQEDVSRWILSRNYFTDIRGPFMDSTMKSRFVTNNVDEMCVVPFEVDSFWDRKRSRSLSSYQNHTFRQHIMGSRPMEVFGTSFQRAQVDYPEMSFLFYTTMRNVMIRANILSTAPHHGQYTNTRFMHSQNWNTGAMLQQHQQQQYRTFASSTGPSNADQSSPSSSTPNPENRKNGSSNDSSVRSPSSSSSSNALQHASKPQIPVPSPMVQDTPFAVKVKHAAEKSMNATVSAITSLASMIAKTPGVMWYYITHPKEFREKLTELKELAKKEAHHYYMGSKLLMADIKTARQIVGRTLNGTPLTRRERKQLIRTVTDVFRLVPMSIFVLIPFMEFALPFALKIFPNMLPSTFQDSLKAEETMKRELKSRLAMAEFFQE